MQRDAKDQQPIYETMQWFIEITNLSRRKSYELVSSGEVPGVIRLGRAIRLNRDKVLTWLEEETTK